MSAKIDIQKISKTYPGGVEAVRNIELSVRPGEFVSLVGESGCGKSTLLRLVGGLEEPTEGRISIDDRTIKGPGLDRGMVFQEARLYPWLTVEENIAFGCRETLSPVEKKKAVEEHLELIGLTDFRNAYPSQLSGGMKQRAALARALVSRPQVLLLDEPFGALDALTRIHMQEELLRLWERQKITILLVTHDIDEAVFLADRVAVFSPRPGTLRQVMEVPLKRHRDRNASEFLKIRKSLYDQFFQA